MDVEEVELVELRDFGHAAGEGEVVGRVLKEGVVGDGDFVEEDAVLAAGEAKGLLVGDEVDLVAAGGELDAELRGDDAGAAVGGVAGDTDLHTRSSTVRVWPRGELAGADVRCFRTAEGAGNKSRS